MHPFGVRSIGRPAHVSASDVDLRSALGSARAPTLVMCRRHLELVPHGRYLADHVTGQLPAPKGDRVSPPSCSPTWSSRRPHAEQMGDRRWRELLATDDAIVRAEHDRFGGHEVKTTGDGVLATFDGPARAIRCASAIRDAVQTPGMQSEPVCTPARSNFGEATSQVSRCMWVSASLRGRDLARSSSPNHCGPDCWF